MSDTETVTFEIDGDGETGRLEVPAGLLEAVAEDDQTGPEVLGDVAMLSLANRIHHVVHHGEETDPELEAIEAETMELFEERFGVSFAEATGHDH